MYVATWLDDLFPKNLGSINITLFINVCVGHRSLLYQDKGLSNELFVLIESVHEGDRRHFANFGIVSIPSYNFLNGELVSFVYFSVLYFR
jgi:hypothetical protein